MTAKPGLLARLDDRINPVLVKDVRQLLRGAFFRRASLFVTTGTLLTGLFALLVNDADECGQALFGVTITFLLLSLYLLLPLAAFFALGAEKEEGTYDLLALSNLHPRQVVLGKWLASGVVGLLFFASFAPIVTASLLLPGVDSRVVLTSLLVTAIGGGTLAMVALALSSLTAARLGRALAIVFLMMLIGAAGIIHFALYAFSFSRGSMRGGGTEAFVTMIVIVALIGAAITLLALALAAARLAHPEEDRSGGLRLAATIVSLGFPPAIAVVALFLTSGSGPDDEFFSFMACVALAMNALIAIFVATEPERMSRRVKRLVPRSRVLALLRLPFLPGGGRGYLWFLLIEAATLLLCAGIQIALGFGHDGLMGASLLAAWFAVLVGLPGARYSRRSADVRIRARARVMAFLLVPLLILVPMLAGMLMGSRDVMQGEHPLNPFWLLDEYWDGSPSGAVTLVLGGALALAVLLNAARVVNGIYDVLTARDRREVQETPPSQAAATP